MQCVPCVMVCMLLVPSMLSGPALGVDIRFTGPEDCAVGLYVLTMKAAIMGIKKNHFIVMRSWVQS